MLVYISEVMCAGLVGSALQYRPIHKILTNMIDDGDHQSPFIGSAWHQSQFWRHLPHLNWGCPLLSLILGQMRSKMIVIEKPDRQSLARWSMTWSAIHFSWIGLNPASQFQCCNLPQQFNTLKKCTISSPIAFKSSILRCSKWFSNGEWWQSSSFEPQFVN